MLEVDLGWSFLEHQTPSEARDAREGNVVPNEISPCLFVGSRSDGVASRFEGDIAVWGSYPVKHVSAVRV